jgi:hypothetical protein
VDKLQFIRDTFVKMQAATGGEFVCLRNYDKIPDGCSLKNDIDVLVPKMYRELVDSSLKHDLGYEGWVDTGKYMYGAEPHIHYEHKQIGVHIDTVTGLYYRSLKDKNVFINIDINLTSSMLANRCKPLQGVHCYEPDPNDNIVHLLCHGIFDKRQTKIYADRINELFEFSKASRILELLSMAFGSANEAIYNVLSEGRAADVYDVYIGLTNY